MDLFKVSNVYKQTTGVKKVYEKTMEQDLKGLNVSYAKIDKECFVASQSDVEKIENFLKTPRTLVRKGVNDEWKASIESRLEVIETDLQRLLNNLTAKNKK